MPNPMEARNVLSPSSPTAILKAINNIYVGILAFI